jgi:hypothetical protein
LAISVMHNDGSSTHISTAVDGGQHQHALFLQLAGCIM